MEKTQAPLTELITKDKAEQREYEDLRQEITIGSNRPMECSSSHCVAITRQLTNQSEYIIVNTRKGMILLHLICAGINPNGNLEDASYHRYIGRQLIRRFQA